MKSKYIKLIREKDPEKYSRYLKYKRDRARAIREAAAADPILYKEYREKKRAKYRRWAAANPDKVLAIREKRKLDPVSNRRYLNDWRRRQGPDYWHNRRLRRKEMCRVR